MELKRTEFSFISEADGLEISALRIEPADADNIRGIVQFVHGMTEYKERYIGIMEFLAEHGFLCTIHDHRGHGKSVKHENDLGFMYDAKYTGLVEDAHHMTLLTKKYSEERTGKKLPVLLAGHSMGSLVVRCYIKKYDADIDKLIVMGCPSKPAGSALGIPLVKVLKFFKGEKAKSTLMDKLSLGSFEKKFKHENLRGAWLNTDKEEVNKYNNHPLCGFSFTLNGYESLLKATNETYNGKGYEMKNKNLPIRFLSGKDDPCGISEKAVNDAAAVLKKAGYTDVKVKLYDGMRHEILLAPDKHLVYEDILNFAEA